MVNVLEECWSSIKVTGGGLAEHDESFLLGMLFAAARVLSVCVSAIVNKTAINADRLVISEWWVYKWLIWVAMCLRYRVASDHDISVLLLSKFLIILAIKTILHYSSAWVLSVCAALIIYKRFSVGKECKVYWIMLVFGDSGILRQVAIMVWVLRLHRPVGYNTLGISDHWLRKFTLPFVNNIKRKPLSEFIANMVKILLVLDFQIFNVKLQGLVFNVACLMIWMTDRSIFRDEIRVVLHPLVGNWRLGVVVVCKVQEPLIVASSTEVRVICLVCLAVTQLVNQWLEQVIVSWIVVENYLLVFKILNLCTVLMIKWNVHTLFYSNTMVVEALVIQYLGILALNT